MEDDDCDRRSVPCEVGAVRGGERGSSHRWNHGVEAESGGSALRAIEVGGAARAREPPRRRSGGLPESVRVGPRRPPRPGAAPADPAPPHLAQNRFGAASSHQGSHSLVVLAVWAVEGSGAQGL